MYASGQYIKYIQPKENWNANRILIFHLLYWDRNLCLGVSPFTALLLSQNLCDFYCNWVPPFKPALVEGLGLEGLRVKVRVGGFKGQG